MSESRGPGLYRWIWTILWVTVAAVGGSLNVAAHGWSTTIGIAVVVGVLVAGFHYNRANRPARKPHDGLLLITGLSAIGSVSVVGWVTTLGPGALMLPLVAVLSWPGTYPYLASQPRIRDWRGRLAPYAAEPSPPDPPNASSIGAIVTFPANPDPAAASPNEPPAPVKTLTDEQLGQAWRASSKTLEHLFLSSDTAQQAKLITRRQEYLDEFEHRNPDGFARWLASGAQPAGDPSRFL